MRREIFRKTRVSRRVVARRLDSRHRFVRPVVLLPTAEMSAIGPASPVVQDVGRFLLSLGHPQAERRCLLVPGLNGHELHQLQTCWSWQHFPVEHHYLLGQVQEEARCLPSPQLTCRYHRWSH